MNSKISFTVYDKEWNVLVKDFSFGEISHGMDSQSIKVLRKIIEENRDIISDRLTGITGKTDFFLSPQTSPECAIHVHTSVAVPTLSEVCF